MHRPTKKVVIVGGGSAGWLTAGILASHFDVAADETFEVVLIESPDVPTVGVGEGTWPSMRSTLQSMGIRESQFILECDASLKQGTRFDRWITGEADYYYHPFSLPQGFGEIDLSGHWHKVRHKISFADAVCQQGALCDKGLAPKSIGTPEYAFNVNYGYHLNAGKFADFLMRHCTQTLGVRHVLDHVTGIDTHPNGDIEALRLQHGDTLRGDLFVDCTGFSALLIGQHYNVPSRSVRDVLYNDSALAAQVPYRNPDDPIASHTLSTAQSAGWIWSIGLPTRRGIGHVYASDFISDDDAERELRTYIADLVGQPAAEALDVRKISFDPGYRETFWHHNCVAVGLSAGFVEPMEASALVLVEFAARAIAEQFPATRDVMPIAARRFNARFTDHWQRIVDFLKLHYLLNRREDDGYWAAHRELASTPESLRDLLMLWQHQAPWLHDAPAYDELFSSASFQYVLYGMGFATKPTTPPRRTAATELARANELFRHNAERTARLVRAQPTNRELLAKVAEFGFQTV